jgi:hypothetical protein
MRKYFTIFLIFIFALGLVPVNFSQAITQNQINAEVQIVCTDGADKWFSGSGTIIDPKGIILTNRHVVEGAYKNICFIGFLESINQEPSFGSKDSPNLAEVKYITTTNDMDAAVLYLDNKNNKVYPYVNIWNSNSSSLMFGDKIEVVGYPSIGGSTITYTSGDFSGFGSQSDGTQNYIKTTAVLEHGNSGGSAYNQKGEFVGIPSMVVTGSLNSISFVLSVNSIKKWLSSFLGSDYKQEIIEQKPIIEQPKVNLQNDITPPEIKNAPRDAFWYKAFDEQGNIVKGELAGNNNSIYDLYSKNDFRKIQITMGTDRYQWSMYDMDKESGIYSTYYIVSNNLADINNNIGTEYVIKYLPHPNYEYFPINDFLAELTPVITIPNVKGQYYVGIRFKDKVGNISNPYIITYIYGKDYVQPKVENTPNGDDNANPQINKYDSILSAKLKGKILLQVESHGEAWYVNPKDAKKYYMADGNKAYNIMRNFGVGITNKDLEKVKTNKIFAKSNSGKIFLQVEAKGEAYYIDFNGAAHYLKDGTAAYEVMRSLGLGITNNDLNKIPAGNL